MMKLLRALTIAAGGLLALVAVLVVIRGWRAFSDLALTVEDSIDAGDRAYVQTRLRGTHDGPFMTDGRKG